jgi:hypothetical protein
MKRRNGAQWQLAWQTIRSRIDVQWCSQPGAPNPISGGSASGKKAANRRASTVKVLPQPSLR